jgi:hypothetical protein
MSGKMWVIRVCVWGRKVNIDSPFDPEFIKYLEWDKADQTAGVIDTHTLTHCHAQLILENERWKLIYWKIDGGDVKWAQRWGTNIIFWYFDSRGDSARGIYAKSDTLGFVIERFERGYRCAMPIILRSLQCVFYWLTTVESLISNLFLPFAKSNTFDFQSFLNSTQFECKINTQRGREHALN